MFSLLQETPRILCRRICRDHVSILEILPYFLTWRVTMPTVKNILFAIFAGFHLRERTKIMIKAD